MDLNLLLAWIWIGTGLLVGAVIGLWFHDDDWLGGYNSWRRRMLRLGHISFFGTAIINLMFWFTARELFPDALFPLTSTMLYAGAIAMPAVCFLSAWKKPFRHLFFIPVLCLIIGVFHFILTGLLS